MKIVNVVLLVVLLALAGCRTEAELATLTANAPEPTPSSETLATPLPATPTHVPSQATPTQATIGCDYSAVLGDGFCLINANSELNGTPLSVEWQWRVLQEYPPGYQLYNLLETENGMSGEDFYTDYAEIRADAGAYHFYPDADAGRWGFSTPPIIIHENQCVLVKMIGHSSIQTIEHSGWNFSGGLIIEKQGGAEYTRGWNDLPPYDEYEMIWTQWLSPGAYTFTAFIQVAYATVLPGTDISIDAIAIGRDIDEDHCGLLTPKL